MNFMQIALLVSAFIVGLAVGWAVFRRKAVDNTEAEQLRSELVAERERAIRLEMQNEALDARIEIQKTEGENLRKQMELKFEQISGRILENLSQKLSTQSAERLDVVIAPFRERIGELQKQISESFTQQGKEQYSLKTEIKNIVEMNEKMRTQAENLTRALKGDVKAQGNWGEIMLERILEESGLQKEVGYTLQGAEMKLSNAEGNPLRPDVIVHLPDGKHIIIDAKVSLVAYERFCNEEDEAAKAVHFKDFLKSLRAHVNGLEGKRYQDIDTLGTPDFVFMFLPIEGAYSLAVQSDRELHSYAWGKKIVLVCPTTLFATLQTIASLWRIEKQNRNAEDIARRAGQIYDKLEGFVRDLQAVGANLERAQGSYEAALGKLQSGKGNLIGQVEKLKELGAKTTKSLPIGEVEEDEKVVSIG